jgi:hypothetical protein
MGFSFRKSIRLTKGLRLNLSRSGLGISGGARGARISAGPRGIGVSGGAGGLRYQKQITGSPIKSENASEKSGNKTEEEIQQILNDPEFQKGINQKMKYVLSFFFLLFMGCVSCVALLSKPPKETASITKAPQKKTAKKILKQQNSPPDQRQPQIAEKKR